MSTWAVGKLCNPSSAEISSWITSPGRIIFGFGLQILSCRSLAIDRYILLASFERPQDASKLPICLRCPLKSDTII